MPLSRRSALGPCLALILSRLGVAGGAALPEAPDSWVASVSANIAASEYHLAAREDGGGFTAPNRAQDLRARWQDGVVVLTPRVDGAAWSMRCELVAVGRAGRVRPAPAIDWEDVSEGVIEWTRDDLREWYRNDARGIEQGFTIGTRPAGDARDPVVLESLVEGLLAYPSEDAQSVAWRTPAGIPAMRLSQLIARDATGAELPSCFDASPGMLSVLVDDAGATYPITIDPLMTSPEWTADSDQVDANLGFAVATAGDVNGDGYSDVIVGAPTWDGGESSEGGAFVYMGSPSGLATTAAWSAESDQASASFGYSVATAGDVDGDGFSDVIVGARLFDFAQLDEGAAFVYRGSAAGLAAAPAWRVLGGQPGARFGYSVSTAGDVNGDGFSDVIVGSPTYDRGQANEGRAAVFHGSASGLATTPAWTAESDQAGAFLGYSVACAGDVNGDGYSDVIAGADAFDGGESGEGRAFVWHGSAAGLLALPAWTAEGNQVNAQFGYSVAGAGDVDGDGFADVIVGARWFDGGQVDEGRAFVYRGSAAGLSAAAAWTAEPNQPDAQFGTSVATAGDVNDDGFADVVVGAPLWDGAPADEGAAFAYFGSPAGLATTPTWTVESNQATASFGLSVASAGDVDGDGHADVIVGSPLFDDGESDEGRAWVFGGSAAGLAATPAWSAEGNQDFSFFGDSVASAGDVNGDGYSDVIVGADFFDNGSGDEGRALGYLGSAAGLSPTPSWTAEGAQVNGRFGCSVSTAGDVNGDGYSDVVVGAWVADNGEPGEGRAFAYLGSPAGLSTTAAWTGEGGQADARYGRSVATAGDVNGDGYSDIIVGAMEYDNGIAGAGRAYVYVGSPLGLAPAAAWMAEGDHFQAQVGSRVAPAGDVNGDGYSDVIVGASNYGNGEADGRVSVYHGSPSGLSPRAAWTAAGDQGGIGFGDALATAGDVNGDGYSDVIVGVPDYENGEVAEGRAVVYQGSPSGLSATAAWTAESNQVNAAFGISVSTAGDVNGDGYSDVLVGASYFASGEPEEGRAFVYFGSASGLAPSPGWTAELNQAFAKFGSSVSTAGDVNGDGYSDVIVGAQEFENDDGREGGAFLFYGNDGDGLDRIPRQRRFDDSAPIDLLGLGDETNGFAIHARARSPFGRDHVRLEAEVRPLGTPFDGTGLLTTPFTDTGLPRAGGSFVDLSVADAPLALAPHHWRVRLHGLLPFPWWSHWMSLPGNAVTETDVRAALPRCDEPSPMDLRPFAPPLLVSKTAAPDTLSLTWEDVRAPRYHVYGGDLADLAPARPVPQQIACDILANASAVVVPGAGRWFVVVASCATLESSYGRDSFGVERDAAATPCP
jgi:hypothetical protein